MVVLITEREHEWHNIHQYVLKDGRYSLVKEKLNDFKEKPNILSVEFSDLTASHGEMSAGGIFSVSFYDPDRYFGPGSKEKSDQKIEIKVDCRNERYSYHPLLVNIYCSEFPSGPDEICSGWTEAVFIPKEGHLFDYPFDRLVFDIAMSTKPEIDFDQIDIYNRTRGILILAPDTLKVENSTIMVGFETKRKNSIMVVFVIIAASLLLYIFLILAFAKKMGTLISAVGGFFISVWSIRTLFREDALVFPNIMDLTIILVSVILLVGILSKIMFARTVKEE